MISEWAQSAGAVVRHGGLMSPDLGEQLEREEARRWFRETHASAIAVQERLVREGWPGAWIPVGPTRPPELAPLFAAQSAESTRVGVFTTGNGPDGEYRAMMTR